MDPVDLLCRPRDVSCGAGFLSGMTWPSPAHNVPHIPGLLPRGTFPHQPIASVQPLGMGGAPFYAPAAPMQSQSIPPGLLVPPGLDDLLLYNAAQPLPEPALVPLPLPPQPTVHSVWALEAKFKADQAQEQQRQWAESMQLQYLKGGASQEEEASAKGAAFDQLVRQMGLKSETPRRNGRDEPVLGQTPPSKQQVDRGTPQKEDAVRTPQKTWRRVGEKENLPSPASTISKEGALGRRSRAFRRTQAAGYH